jgi:hypothetical protein
MPTLAERIIMRAEQEPTAVLARKELDFGASYDAVGRALRCLVADRRLVREGRGRYRLASGQRMRSAGSAEERILRKIGRSKRNVFLRDDFADFGSYVTVGRALRRLTDKARLVQIGYGLYAKGQVSPFTGKPAPLIGFARLAREALSRLGRKVESSSLEVAYNSGLSTQVPTGRTLRVDKRTRRRIGYDGKYVNFERAR